MNNVFINAYVFQSTIKNFINSLSLNILIGCFQCTIVLFQYGVYLPENHLILVFSKRNNSSFIDA